MIQFLLSRPLYWLLAALPVAAILEATHAGGLWVFVASGIAIIPLAALMGHSTENLAATLGTGVGGLLNATFGNAAELIIAIVALTKGPQMYPLVKASITGSIIGNALLVLGLAILMGGLRYRGQSFNRTAGALGSTLLALAALGLLIPTVYIDLLEGPGFPARAPTVNLLSEEIAGILAFVYALSLVFALRTHRHVYDVVEATAEGALAAHPPTWGRGVSLTVLVLATVGTAWMSEMLVNSIESAATSLGMNQVFTGVIVVAVIGNAAEHSTAVLVALKNKMDLAVNIAVGSSIQVALFVAPVLVFTNLAINGEPLDLHFTPLEVIAVVIAIAVLFMVNNDGESHWLEGAMLLAVYAILALAFYHLPEDSHSVASSRVSSHSDGIPAPQTSSSAASIRLIAKWR